MQRILAVALLVGLSANLLSGQTSGLNEKDAQCRVIAVVDMAEVFKKYNKFQVLRDGLKSVIAEADVEARKMAAKASLLKSELEKLTPGTMEAKEKQLQIFALQQDFKSFKEESQKDFKSREARIYQQIYLEVGDVVEGIATDRNFSMVLRYNRKPLVGQTEPGDVLKAMNKQIIYTDPGNDITDETVDRLNKKYASTSK